MASSVPNKAPPVRDALLRLTTVISMVVIFLTLVSLLKFIAN